MIRARGFAVVTAIVVLAVPTHVVGTTTTVTSIVSPEAGTAFRLADAFRFRSDFGLRSDEDFVAESFTSAAFDSGEWGVPLDRDELADLAARTVAREALEPAIEFANEQPKGSGVYVDQHRGGVVVFLTTAASQLEKDLVAIVPSGAAYEVRAAQRTMSDLHDVQGQVVDQLPALDSKGLIVRNVAIDVMDNVVRVGTAGPSDAVAATLAAADVPTDALQFYQQSPIHSDSCTSMSFCWPLKGGVRIYLVDNSIYKCTSGFIAKTDSTGALVDLTAGHCLALANGSGTDYWGHALTPAGAENFGSERAHTFTDYSRGDIGLITLDAETLTAIAGAKNAIHTSDPGTNEVVDGVRGNTSQLFGDSVCRMGWGTWNASGQVQGMTCGWISDVDATNLSESGIHILHTNTVTFDSIAGDSGGPVWHKVLSPEPILYAYGTHVHSDPDDDQN